MLFILFGLLRITFATPEAEKSVSKIIFSNNDMIYFGDSVLNADHKNIKNPSSLVNIFEEYIQKNVLEISGAAYSPFIYQQNYNVIDKYSSKTKLVIIPINIRSFSSSWNKVPEYQFEQECAYLTIIVFKPNMFCLKEHLKNKFYSDYLIKKNNNFYNSPIKAKGFFENTKNRFMQKFEENCEIKKNNNKIDFGCINKLDYDQVIDYMQHGLPLLLQLSHEI